MHQTSKTCISYLQAEIKYYYSRYSMISLLFVMIYDQQKPLWLEMQNVHPTALQQTPTRLILKLGDDLRQDMITLRMFSLFEKVHMKNLPSAAYAKKKKTPHGQHL